MLLSVLGLTKSYRRATFGWKGFAFEKTPALSDLDLSFPERKLTVLLGPNGAGKTTLLKILAGILIPDSGKIQWPESSPNISRTAYIFGEERSFYWRLSGRQNLEFFAALSNLSPRQAKSKIEAVARELELTRDLHRPFQEYSSGTRQKLAIARALLVEAETILMDEPTKSLDPQAAAHFRNLILDELRGRGRTIVLATHNLAEAATLGDFYVILNHGKKIDAAALPHSGRLEFLTKTYQNLCGIPHADSL